LLLYAYDVRRPHVSSRLLECNKFALYVFKTALEIRVNELMIPVCIYGYDVVLDAHFLHSFTREF
jgi:hypothetical protein